MRGEGWGEGISSASSLFAHGDAVIRQRPNAELSATGARFLSPVCLGFNGNSSWRHSQHKAGLLLSSPKMVFPQKGLNRPAEDTLVFERSLGDDCPRYCRDLNRLDKLHLNKTSAFCAKTNSRAPSGHPLASIGSTQGGARRRACPGLISPALTGQKTLQGGMVVCELDARRRPLSIVSRIDARPIRIISSSSIDGNRIADHDGD